MIPLSSQNFSTSLDVNSPPPSVFNTLSCFADCFSAITLNLSRIADTSLLALIR
ncbi:unnamed protein product [Lupinus luteus]|uniref:Uncharacterized protein n=1 Tax=Lupinus luteus TaxID=3873 RepID=A0AAV1WLL5_LUPLU